MAASDFEGSWKITKMDVWDQNAVDMVVTDEGLATS